jgi:hypothetical protein
MTTRDEAVLSRDVLSVEIISSRETLSRCKTNPAGHFNQAIRINRAIFAENRAGYWEEVREEL